jgi:cyclic pyranopterin phosphate synthase
MSNFQKSISCRLAFPSVKIYNKIPESNEKEIPMSEFTHFNPNGEAWMVDVSEKKETTREATAEGRIFMSPECFQKIKNQEISKGDVLGVARIAGIMGAKKTSDLIPLCHILNLTKAEITFQPEEDSCSIRTFCTVRTVGKTGVEMEALTGVNIALLTIYDMCKAVDRSMEISQIHLLQKSGGKSGDYTR